MTDVGICVRKMLTVKVTKFAVSMVAKRTACYLVSIHFHYEFCINERC